jgi:hydrogenase maturation protease
MTDKPEKVLILGVGNILLDDEGIGVHVIKYLEKQELPSHVSLLDGGTGGFYILSVLEEFQHIIMIDATIDGSEPGTLTVLEPKFASDFPTALSSHDIGLKDLIESAALLDHLPKIYLITVSISQEQDMNMELSEEIKKTIPSIHQLILKIIRQINTNK